MFKARPTAPRFQFTLTAILVAATWSAQAAAQSAATLNDQWHAAGESPRTYSQSAAQTATSPTWRLPNGQTSPDAGQAQTTGDASNPLRKKQPPKAAAATAKEPRAFQPPTTAKKLTTAQSPAADNTNAPVEQRSRSVAQAPTAPPMVQQSYGPPRIAANNRPATSQRPQYRRPSQSNATPRPGVDRPSETLWDTITVAFQGEPAAKPKQKIENPPTMENLPMPGDSNIGMQDPTMRHFDGPDNFVGPYQPYGDGGPGCCNNGCSDGNCGDNCPCGQGCSEPGCGCGCGDACGEPGCACEPGCGCENGCKKDVFCIGPGDDESCHIVQIRWPKWQEVMVFGGVQGFKGPYDQDHDSGNFGFNEGFNIGAKVPYALLGYQFGFRGLENQLNGDAASDTNKQYGQEFVTAGMFHRSCQGLNFGVVWDALNDDRFHTRQYGQLRSEISVIGGGCHEIGFTATIGLNDHGFEDDNGDETFFQASDQYLLFYRIHGPNCGEGRFFGGVTSNSEGLLGADMLLPVGDRFSVQAGFEYLIPNTKHGDVGATQEAWNIGLGLVWHWDGQAKKCFENCYRPMFNVADNGTLIVTEHSHKN